MKILFVTNYYPPSNYGWGYMQLCEEVADGLCARGNTISILTSTYCHGNETTRPYPVHRKLKIDPDWHGDKSAPMQFFVGRRQRELHAIKQLRGLVSEFHPDVIFIWHAIGLPRVLLQAAEHMPGVVVAYYLAGYLPELPDEYISYWQAEPIRPSAKLLKRPLSKIALRILRQEGKPIALKFDNVICVSEYVRQRLVSQELISEQALVIHNGVNLSTFSPNANKILSIPTDQSRIISCLIAGRVAPEKGIHTVIDGFAKLRAQGDLIHKLSLTILGDGPGDYYKYLMNKVKDGHLQDIIEFLPPIPREKMPEMLTRHDVLILPSEYQEPIARAMQEAMAMGLLVIGTLTGGSGELLVHEKTGLVFKPGKPKSLTIQLNRALNDPELVIRLAFEGQKKVTKYFDILRTIEQIEIYLLRLVEEKRQ